MRRNTSPRLRGTITVAALALAVFSLLVLAGCACTPIDQPITEQGGVDSTGTVQADLPMATTGTVEATLPASVTPTATPEATPTIWPVKVGTFAKNFKHAVWYPAYIPKGYKIDSLDIVELDKGTGLICDIVYLNGDKVLQFTQGSPTDRKQDIVSAGKVPWGTDKADIMYQDPTDNTTPPMIIYSKNGTYIELQGDPSLDELKKVAASMVAVK
jgi:hypothetical protein